MPRPRPSPSAILRAGGRPRLPHHPSFALSCVPPGRAGTSIRLASSLPIRGETSQCPKRMEPKVTQRQVICLRRRTWTYGQSFSAAAQISVERPSQQEASLSGRRGRDTAAAMSGCLQAEGLAYTYSATPGFLDRRARVAGVVSDRGSGSNHDKPWAVGKPTRRGRKPW